jgi:hypothetical protein
MPPIWLRATLLTLLWFSSTALQAQEYSYLENPAEVRAMVRSGQLVELSGNADYELRGVRYKVVRPEVRLFVVNLSEKYHKACGRKLVVTSGTRPRSYNRQIPNASRTSYHMIGMAVDFGMPPALCQKWWRDTLQVMERAQVLDVIREFRPPHYHVELNQGAYYAYVTKRPSVAPRRNIAPRTPAPNREPILTPRRLPHSNSTVIHYVRRGESLTGIAQEYGVTEEDIKRANGLTSSRIRIGERLKIPPARK